MRSVCCSPLGILTLLALCWTLRVEGDVLKISQQAVQNFKDVFPWFDVDSALEGKDGEIQIDVDVNELERLKRMFGKRLVMYERPPCRNYVGSSCKREGFKNFEEFVSWMDTTSSKYPSFTKLTQIGESLEKRAILMLEISNKPGDQSELEPNVKLVAAMHGDEIVGTMMQEFLITYLLTNYEKDEFVKYLVDNVHIFFIPILNPDGFFHCKRGNGHNIDLNRNFPDQFTDPVDTTEKREPETAAIMKISKAIPFTLSGNMHGGDVVANYPFDAGKGDSAHSEDEDIFIKLASTYAETNKPMKDSKDFPGGIVNGATWYILNGGMQDWNYVWAGCMELTLELSCQKWPPYDDMMIYWEENRESLLNYVNLVNLHGIKGIITDLETKQPITGFVTVESRKFKVYTEPTSGKYFRLLLPGTYTVTANATGYASVSQVITIGDPQLTTTTATTTTTSTTTTSTTTTEKQTKSAKEDRAFTIPKGLQRLDFQLQSTHPPSAANHDTMFAARTKPNQLENESFYRVYYVYFILVFLVTFLITVMFWDIKQWRAGKGREVGVGVGGRATGNEFFYV